MKIRLATKEDKGPYLSGIIECDHIILMDMIPTQSNRIRHIVQFVKELDGKQFQL